MANIVYAVGGPNSNYDTVADIPHSVWQRGSGDESSNTTIQLYGGTHTWPQEEKAFHNVTVVGMGARDAVKIKGSILLGTNGANVAGGHNFFQNINITATASTPAIDARTPASLCGVHAYDCRFSGGTFAIQNHTPIAKIGATTDFYDTHATSVERVWSDCTKFLSCNANVMAISSTGAGAWCTPPVNTQDETKLVGKVDLVYAAANAGNMTESVVARTIVS